MPEKTKQVILNIDAGQEDDPEEIERFTQQLREDLTELDVEAVDLVRAGETPAKAKVGDPITWGTLLLTLAASGGVITTVINVLQSWLTRQERRSISLEIDGDKLEIKGISSKEQQRLINEWRSRHTKGEVGND